MNKINILNLLSVVQIDFDIWSGQTRLTPDDLKLGEGGEVPPEKIAQLGSKKICDPLQLKEFHRLKSEARRYLLRHGVPFMNGYAVPADKVDAIEFRLAEIQKEFDAVKQTFINGYNRAVDAWIEANPDYAQALRAGALAQQAVEKRIGFDYQIFMIRPVEGNDANSARLNNKVGRLGDDLLSEIAIEADDFYRKRLAGRTECAASTKQTLKGIRDKVDGLSFLNNNFIPLVNLLDRTLRGYEINTVKRNISGLFFYQVVAVTLIMCDRTRIKEYASGSLNVDQMAEQMSGGRSWSRLPSVEESHKPTETQNKAGQEGAAREEAPEADVSTPSEATDDDQDIDEFFKNYGQPPANIETPQEPADEESEEEVKPSPEDDMFF